VEQKQMTEKKPMRAELVDDYRIKCQLLLEEVIDAEEAAKLAAAEIAELRAERDRLKAEYDAYRETSCEIISCLKSALLDIKHFGAGFAQDRARKALGDAS